MRHTSSRLPSPRKSAAGASIAGAPVFLDPPKQLYLQVTVTHGSARPARQVKNWQVDAPPPRAVSCSETCEQTRQRARIGTRCFAPAIPRKHRRPRRYDPLATAPDPTWTRLPLAPRTTGAVPSLILSDV